MSETSLWDLRETIKRNNIHIMVIPEGKRKKREQKVFLKQSWLKISQTWEHSSFVIKRW